VLGAAYHPGRQLTVLLVRDKATAWVFRGLSDGFQLTSAMAELAPAGGGTSPARSPAR